MELKESKTFNNLAVLHAGINRLDDAEREFNETLTIYRRLAESKPEQYSSYVATTLNNLGTLLLNSEKFEKAEMSYNQAIEILRKLSESHPDAFIPNLLETLENSRFDDARECPRIDFYDIRYIVIYLKNKVEIGKGAKIQYFAKFYKRGEIISQLTIII